MSRLPWRGIVVVAILALGLLALWLRIDALNEAASVNARQADANARRLQEARADVGALAQQVERLGGNPVVTPGEVPPPVPGTQGIPGRAPTQAEIDQAVASYCQSTGACTGPAGADASVSAAQVAAAVVAYCDPRGNCRGPRGVAGEDGSDGQDGAPGEDGQDGADGAQGPPPSDEQVAAAVVAYCEARDGCRGPQGERGVPGQDGARGEPGAQGPAGRGIAEIACDTVGQPITFTVTFTDGTTQTFSCGGGEGGPG